MSTNRCVADPMRRAFIKRLAFAAGANSLRIPSAEAFAHKSEPRVERFRTSFKLGKLVLEPSGMTGSFDEKAVDCPFVFSANGRFYMTYVGFDGIGYQTGLAESNDLVKWQRVAKILARDPLDPIIRYNVAMLSILREGNIGSVAPLKRVGGRYLGAWHAYPGSGYEAGPAVIGLAWSKDLLHWERTEPILKPSDGAAWEQGGLYKPYLTKSDDTYYLFYNAKNNTDGAWVEQIGVATSKDLVNWNRYDGNPIVPVGSSSAPDSRFASDPCVVRCGGWWAMYYYGLAADGHARDLLALSPTPLGAFRKVDEIMIDVGPPGSVDETYAHKPSVISVHGDLYHFYCAVNSPGPNSIRGISVARSRGWYSG